MNLFTQQCATNRSCTKEMCKGFPLVRRQPQSITTKTATSDLVLKAVVDITQWIHTEGRNSRTMASTIRGIGMKIRMSGIPVDRIFLGTTVIHPQAAAFAWKWESSGKESTRTVDKETFEKRHELFGNDAPLQRLEFCDSVRILKSDRKIPRDCRPAFETDGYEDMYGLPYHCFQEYGGGITWATKRKGGFSDFDIWFFNAIMPALSTLIQLLLKDQCMHSILRTYLGSDPGTRVHNGSIDRGDSITVRSVIWFSDIRGFSKLSAKLERDEVVALINDVFEITEKVLTDKGGEILKFIGDGIMAVFTVEGGNEALVCQRAREAAEEVQVRLKQQRASRNETGLPSAEVGIGLHYGDASYGNIGSPNRLDFTLIGQCVNVASRIEGLCSDLGLSVLASADFVELEGHEAWSSCGKHQLKGFAEPMEVFDLSDTAIRG